jgi:hypothetical protein
VKWKCYNGRINHPITGQSLRGLVRIQFVKSFSEWPKVEGFRSLTPLGESEKIPLGGGSSYFQKRASSSEYVPTVYMFET